MRIISFLVAVILLAGCGSSSKTFRKLSDKEKAAYNAARKQWGKDTDAYRILIITDSGNMVMRLYNETPLHRDNFVGKVKAGFYDSLLFHRVIKNFMIQGGDPQSRHAAADKMLGDGEAPGARIPAEIRTDMGIFHKKGVLAAARDNNPEKASSNCQFYIVQGRKFTDNELDAEASKRGIKIGATQRLLYTTVGGTPHLDGNYTVFGELESGFDVLDKISTVKTSKTDRPVGDVRMYMFVLNEIVK
jgi:peptidyl-prolyl cis-trans isomerase B (cyclophilin B)